MILIAEFSISCWKLIVIIIFIVEFSYLMETKFFTLVKPIGNIASNDVHHGCGVNIRKTYSVWTFFPSVFIKMNGIRVRLFLIFRESFSFIDFTMVHFVWRCVMVNFVSRCVRMIILWLLYRENDKTLCIEHYIWIINHLF